jgi:rRNA maturation RNase YbeY
VRIIVGSNPRVAGRAEFGRLGPLLESAGRRWRPSRAVLEVSLIGERRMAFLNRRYKGRRGPTAILTFPYAPGAAPRAAERPIGEICLCWPRVVRAAAVAGVSTRAYLLRLFVHGVVHLRGRRHDTPANEARMEALERSLLRDRKSTRLNSSH